MDQNYQTVEKIKGSAPTGRASGRVPIVAAFSAGFLVACGVLIMGASPMSSSAGPETTVDSQTATVEAASGTKIAVAANQGGYAYIPVDITTASERCEDTPGYFPLEESECANDDLTKNKLPADQRDLLGPSPLGYTPATEPNAVGTWPHLPSGCSFRGKKTDINIHGPAIHFNYNKNNNIDLQGVPFKLFCKKKIQPCAAGKAAGNRCPIGYTDAAGSPSCAGLPCTADDFGDNGVCCTKVQYCGDRGCIVGPLEDWQGDDYCDCACYCSPKDPAASGGLLPLPYPAGTNYRWPACVGGDKGDCTSDEATRCEGYCS